jgi:hypothetical protein
VQTVRWRLFQTAGNTTAPQPQASLRQSAGVTPTQVSVADHSLLAAYPFSNLTQLPACLEDFALGRPASDG